MAAGRDDEGYVLLPQPARHRPNAFTLQIDIEDGEIEPTLVRFGKRFSDGSQVALTECPRESRKSSSIIAISGSSSTTRMLRCPIPSARIGNAEAPAKPYISNRC